MKNIEYAYEYGREGFLGTHKQQGYKAGESIAPAQHIKFVSLLEGLKVGSSVGMELFKAWDDGFEFEKNKMLKNKFPEMYKL